MPDYQLCSDAGATSLCLSCKRNPENVHPDRIGPFQSWGPPDLRDKGGCGSWEHVPIKAASNGK